MKTRENNVWSDAYLSGGNILIYPHEEIVRFINGYVRKFVSPLEYKNIMSIPPERWSAFKSLDLGCGIGRHVKLLDEFNLNPYGIDISDVAIKLGKKWFTEIGKEYLSDKLNVASMENLPFEDQSFDCCVSHSTFDCTSKDIAQSGFQELKRVMRPGGVVYFDVDMNLDRHVSEEKKDIWYSKETTRSYFTYEIIEKFVCDFSEIISFKIIEWHDSEDNCYDRRGHFVIRIN